jgi:pseudaminic acid cytidylyltransferase
VSALCIIPARGGSKRIPRKNIRLFHGRPIIAWPISTALESGCFDRVVVSTDDEEIAEVARKWGAEVPFLRPPELADDHTGTRAVLKHAVRELTGTATTVQVGCIYATAVFVSCETLRSAVALLREKPDADCVMTVAAFEASPFRAWHRHADGSLYMQWPEYMSTRSQDLPRLFYDPGQLYVWQAEYLLRKSERSPRILPLEIARESACDIDTPEDWSRAERMFSAGVPTSSQWVTRTKPRRRNG